MDSTRREALGLIAAGGAMLAPLGMAAQAADRAAAKPDADGWQPLFNGRDLTGWTFFQDGNGAVDRDHVIDIHDGMLHILGPAYRGRAAAGMGYIATAQEYGDYHLSLEYKWGTRRYEPRPNWKRDSGILYHAPIGADLLWPDCIEYQIMERNTGDALPINHRAVGGISLGGLPSWPDNPPGYHVYGAQVDAGGTLRQNFKADGDFALLTEWNTVELIATGQKAAHIVNGRIVNTLFDMEARDPNAKGRYVPLTRGRILLQIECAEILFRNVRIKPL